MRSKARGDLNDFNSYFGDFGVPVDGAGYALYEVPKDLETYTAELVIGDDVVPGSREVQRVPAQ